MEKQVIIYGASGYTGKLIAWHLAEYGIPFIAAGRNLERLQQQMAEVPELAGADYECVAVEHNEQALTELFSGKQVVYNVVGPFMQLGDPVARAALAAGVHYLDTTGEQDWIFHLRDNYGQAFADKGLLLIPACSWMWVGGLLAAEIALEDTRMDTLDIAYLADSNTSVASTKSFLRMLTKPQYYLEHNEMLEWPLASPFPVAVPGTHRILNALPWSGGAEPIWYRDDDRVRNCSVLVAFKNQELLMGIVDILKDFEANHRDKSIEDQEAVTNAIGGQLVSEEPDREEPRVNRSTISCYARGDVHSMTVILRGNSPYSQTGAFAAEAIRRILISDIGDVGFVSPARAFGARKLLAAIAERGFLDWEVKQQ